MVDTTNQWGGATEMSLIFCTCNFKASIWRVNNKIYLNNNVMPTVRHVLFGRVSKTYHFGSCLPFGETLGGEARPVLWPFHPQHADKHKHKCNPLFTLPVLVILQVVWDRGPFLITSFSRNRTSSSDDWQASMASCSCRILGRVLATRGRPI